MAKTTRSRANFETFYESPEQTISVGGSLTIAHGISYLPIEIYPFLICKTAELGYVIGDLIYYPPNNHTNVHRGYALQLDTTNFYIKFGSNGPLHLINKSTGSGSPITPANWKLIIKAKYII